MDKGETVILFSTHGSMDQMSYTCIPLQASGFRMYAVGRLKSLGCLDGQKVTEEETSAAAKQMISSHISLTNLLGVSYSISAPPPSLSLLPVAEHIHCSAKTDFIHYSCTVSSKDWPTKVI